MITIWDEIQAERQRQVEQLGLLGIEGDHPALDLRFRLIETNSANFRWSASQASSRERDEGIPGQARSHFIKIAALAQLGIESIDRAAQPRPTEVNHE